MILERIRRGQRIDHFETVRQRKHGSLIDISLTVSPIKNSQGKIIGASKIARDITGRKRREAQLLILAREAEHRAKNMLSIVLATVQLSHADTTHELKRIIEGRIHAISNVAELLAESRWKGAELHALVTQELSPFCQHDLTQCRIEGPSLMLEPNTAQALAMTLHELVTNAAKYEHYLHRMAVFMPNGHEPRIIRLSFSGSKSAAHMLNRLRGRALAIN